MSLCTCLSGNCIVHWSEPKIVTIAANTSVSIWDQYKQLEDDYADLKSKYDSLLISDNMRIQIIAELKAALLEVTGNYAVQGKKLELAKEVLTEIAGPNFADKIGVKARECLERLK